MMMKLFIVVTAFIGFSVGVVFAQQGGPPAQVPQQVTAQDLENQLSEVGCRAERVTAAQTIMQLRQQNADLQKQLQKLDPPPKSGATKH